MKMLLLRVIIVTACAAGLTTGCERDSPVLPSTRPTSLTITGPASVAPGATAQFRATVRNFDGSISDITADATWASFEPDVLEMRPGGVAFGKARGPAVISVRTDPTSSSQTMRVLVIEDGTFELSGRVVEVGTQDPVTGAQIEVEEGLGAGLRAISNAEGRYLLYGVGGSVRLTTSADGYPSQTVDLAVSGSMVRDIAMTPQPPNMNLAGQWIVTISAPANCQMLPPDARSREFVASIQHSGTHFTLGLSSPSLIVTTQFGGRMRGNAIELVIPYWDDEYFPYAYSLLDAVQPAGAVGIYGAVSATGDGQRIDGTLDGAVTYYPDAASTVGETACTGKATVGLRRAG